MTAKAISWVLALATGAYMILAGIRSWALVQSGQPVLVILGISVTVIPVIGVWVLWRELSFGRRTQEMGRVLAAEGGLPVDDLPRTPSGRVERDAADSRFAQYQSDVEEHPEDWRCWYRLAIGYDDARDRKRARAAMRRSIALYET